MEDRRDEPSYEQDWKTISKEAQDLSVYLASLAVTDTHSDPALLEMIMGLDRPQLEKVLTELRQRGLLTLITYRRELENVANGGTSEIAPSPYGWTKEQAASILKNLPRGTTLDDPHYRLVPKYKEFVLDEFGGKMPPSEVK